MKKILMLTVIAVMFVSWSAKPNDPKLTKENLWTLIQTLDIKHPKLVFAQAILESGHFSSKNCKFNNNLFGMRFPRIRKTVAVGKTNAGFAVYESWIQSVKDYALFQDYLFRKKEYTKTQYINYLDNAYCANSGYSKYLTKIIKKNQDVFELKPVTEYESFN